jgi:hypothetical protein
MDYTTILDAAHFNLCASDGWGCLAGDLPVHSIAVFHKRAAKQTIDRVFRITYPLNRHAVVIRLTGEPFGFSLNG